LRLAIDGTDAEIIRNLMEIELNKIQERHARNHKSFDFMASVAPAAGMWGTVIGLVGMMRNLQDTSTVGPNMAIALITTLYGSVMANVFAVPTVKRLRILDSEEAGAMEMMIEGVLSIQAGDNPRVVCMKLLSYLTKKDGKAIKDEFMKD
jgi:chemotaxis protein MotA